MADAAPAKSPAKKVTKAKKPAAKPTHPTYAAMIVTAVTALKERNGSSRQAILKYIIANNKVGDEKKAGIRLRLALPKSVLSGALKQVKGTGASGSFRIAKDDAPAKKATKKPVAAAKKVVKKPVAKKVTKKIAVKKVTKKPAVKKAVKKTPVKKVAAKKSPAKKPVAKKAKKPAAKKAKK